LIEWAEHHFNQRQISSDGASVADHLESGREQLAKVKLAKRRKSPPTSIISDDEAPEFPWPLNYLWEYFLEIADAVPRDDVGAPVITWEAIGRWSELMAIWLEPWELRAIVMIGRVGQSAAAVAFSNRMKQVTSHG
jgi:hypothetical protein